MSQLYREFKKFKYKNNSENIKFKVKLYYDKTLIFPHSFSLIFSENGILFKKYNKIFFKLRYENLVKWTVHNDKFILVWNILYLDDLYKKNRMFNYFANNTESILTIESYYYHSLVIEETLNFYINKLMEKPEYYYLFS
tara:strand:- start:168 stop:584 length:417 start_codon:yes stop_codon:yes gene_type:complete